MSEERFDRIESQLQVLETRLRTDVTELRHYMGVIHEDLVDRIRGAAMPEDQLRREWSRGLQQVREETDQRLRPLEVIVPQHSRDIDILKKRRFRD